MKLKTTAVLIPAIAILTSCSATTSLKSKQSDAYLRINSEKSISLNLATKQKYSTTSFGQLIFEAGKGDQSPMYGVMPLKFNGGYLAADILFFAPAMLFNLREVYPYYEFDIEKNVIRYKSKENDAWVEYTPTPLEVARAKKYFKK